MDTLVDVLLGRGGVGSDYAASRHAWSDMNNQRRAAIAAMLAQRGYTPGARESTHVEVRPPPGMIGAIKPAIPDPEPSLWDNFLLNIRRAWPTPLNLPGPKD